ncbi:MAG: nitrile hydratase subunit beta [Oxalobacteraceae bacterium]|jgi:nitrile hydratase beta subunit|nr:nitrile hydratase subunit beta [Oxalobacteraceae bacterium]
MDGFHDLGGRQGFGPVVRDGHTEAFHSEAEIRIAAMWVRLIRHGIYNMDEYRHAIERMEPRHYVGASYYERTFTAVISLCVERGVFSANELSTAAGFAMPLSRPSREGRIGNTPLPEINVGDRVRVKDAFVPGHIRMPGYIRGKEGVVVNLSPAYPYPDAHGHGLESDWQRSFDVRFSARDLWPDGAEEAEVQVGVFHGYLVKTT